MLSKRLENFFKNKKVLITGAAGSIGSNLTKRLVELPVKKVFILDQDESGLFDLWEEYPKKTELILANIRDGAKINRIFKKYCPDIVFHCAAYKHVIWGEKWKDEFIQTNITGTINLINASLKHKVKKFVFISTDKAVNPSSFYGETKKAGELSCLNASKLSKKTEFIIVRFGNVLASRGSVVPVFKKQIERDEPLTVTHKKMRRYFISMGEAIDFILKTTLLAKNGQICVPELKEIYITDLAKLMIALSGKVLPIKFTKPNKGEKLREELMTKEEKKRSVKKQGIYFICPKM